MPFLPALPDKSNQPRPPADEDEEMVPAVGNADGFVAVQVAKGSLDDITRRGPQEAEEIAGVAVAAALVKIGVGQAGAEGLDADSGVTDFFVESDGEVVLIGLGGGIERVGDEGDEGADGGDVDDGALAAGFHGRQDGVAETPNDFAVDAKHGGVGLGRGLEKGTLLAETRVVDEEVQVRDGLGPDFDGVEAGRVVEIGGEDFDGAEFVLEFLEDGFVPAGEVYLGAAGGEFARESLADAAGGAGDEGGAEGEWRENPYLK